MKRILCTLLILLLSVPALAETVQDQALSFIQSAGIETDSVLRIDNEITVTLINGGTASLYTYGDFDPYDLSWRFTGAADSDVALYLDHALGMLASLEEKIPTARETRARDYAVMVSNSLLSLENTGEQGLRVLLAQLSRHDDSGLNSLRARLASQLLDFTDATPVDPAEDGEGYWPSILAFCGGDEVLARAVMALEYPDMEAAVQAYLRANGFEGE